MPLFLMFVAMFAYMVALLVFMFDDSYEGLNGTPMAEYLRVYGIMDLAFFALLVLLQGIGVRGGDALSLPSYFILVWSNEAVQAVLWFAHLAYLVVACVFVFAEVGVAGGDAGEQVYKWILGMFPPIAILVGGVLSAKNRPIATPRDNPDRIVRLF